MSIVDSIKTVIGDSHPFFKLAGLSFVILVVQQMMVNNSATPIFKLTALILMVLALIGFVLQSVHNTITEKNVIMPSLYNPLMLIVRGVQGVISLLPYIALVYYGVTWVKSLLTFLPWVNYLILTFVFVVLFAFLVIGLLLFCRNFNPIRAYNFLYVLKYAGDFIVYSFVLTISIVLLAGIVFFPIGLFIKIVFNYGLIFTYYIIFSALFLVMVIAQYYSQLYFEYIDLGDS